MSSSKPHFVRVITAPQPQGIFTIKTSLTLINFHFVRVIHTAPEPQGLLKKDLELKIETSLKIIN